MAAPPPSLATLLAPWLKHARDYMFGSLDDLAEPEDLDEDLWIEWQLPQHASRAGDEWVLTLETMELLDLLIRAEYRAGWALVLEILQMPVYVGLLEKLPRKIYPKHTIAWSDLEPPPREDGSSLARAEMLATPIGDDLHSPSFQQAKKAMLERCGSERRDRIRVGLKLTMNPQAPNGGDSGGALEQLASLAVLAQDPTRRVLRDELKRVGPAARGTTASFAAVDEDDRVLSPFHFSHVTIVTSGVAITDRMLASICAIGRCGVRVSGLTLGRTHFAPAEASPLATTACLRSLIVSSSATHMALSIGHDMERSVFQAFCSALAVTKTVNDVTFTSQARLRDYWSWIAYAIFSGGVSHGIQYVHLDLLTLAQDDVADFQRVLDANDPLAAIAPTPETVITDDCVDRLTRDPEVVDVRANSTALIPIHDDGGGAAGFAAVLIGADGCTDLRVVDDSISRAHICVLYPGAGLCWLRREAIVARRGVLSPHGQRDAHPPSRHRFMFDRISLEVGVETSLAAVTELVRLVGPLTRILMFYSPHRTILPDSFLHDVLVACPTLERLDLVMVTVASFSWLLESNAAAHVPASLTLTYVRCLGADGYMQLIAGLRDSDARLGRALLELAIHTHLRVLRRLWPDVLGMLTANHRLHRLLLRTESADGTTDDFELLVQQLRRHQGEPLFGRDKPLARRTRLAFISVLSSNSKLPELDASMLSIIFALAAPNRTRICDLMTHVVRPDA